MITVKWIKASKQSEKLLHMRKPNNLDSYMSHLFKNDTLIPQNSKWMIASKQSEKQLHMRKTNNQSSYRYHLIIKKLKIIMLYFQINEV